MTLIGTIFLQRKVILQKESIILKTSIEVIISRNITSDLLIFSIFKKDQPWSNGSCRSFKKIDRDQITLVDLLTRLTKIELIP